nr:hypothetical protein [Tanacetum cinerariifolium]
MSVREIGVATALAGVTTPPAGVGFGVGRLTPVGGVHVCPYKACNGSIAAECKVFVKEEEEFMMTQKNMGGFIRLLTVYMYSLDFKR